MITRELNSEPKSPSRAIDVVGVVGAGTMGVAVAQLFASRGIEVVLVDSDPEALSAVPERMRHGLRMTRLNAPTQEIPAADNVLANTTITTDLGDLRVADVVVENVNERLDVKRPLYREFDRVCPVHVVLAANTSAIPIRHLALASGRPDRVIGMHFMNPVPLKPLVEMIRGPLTSDDTVTVGQELLRAAGKEAIVVNDSPGFVTNRVLMLAVNEAISIVDEGVAPAAAVDRIFRECFGHRMGPLETADLIGLDTVLDTLSVLRTEFEDDKYTPTPLLQQLVERGDCGRKNGRGFYHYLPPRQGGVPGGRDEP